MPESLAEPSAEPPAEPAGPELELVELTPDQAQEAAAAAGQKFHDEIRRTKNNRLLATVETAEARLEATGRSEVADYQAHRAQLEHRQASRELERAERAEAAARHRAGRYLDPSQVSNPAVADQALAKSEAASQQLLEADRIVAEDEFDQDFDRANQAYDDWLSAVEVDGQTPSQRYRARQAHQRAARTRDELSLTRDQTDRAKRDRQQTRTLADEAARFRHQADLSNSRQQEQALGQFGQDLDRIGADYRQAMAPPLSALRQARDRLQADHDQALAAFDQADSADSEALEQALADYEQSSQALGRIAAALAGIEAGYQQDLDSLATMTTKLEIDRRGYQTMARVRAEAA